MITVLFLISFQLGERLEYTAKYGVLSIGTMVLEVSDTMTCGNQPCYHIVSRLTSSSKLGFIFTLNDTIQVCTTLDSLLPVWYEERLHEGKYHNQEALFFDQQNHSVTYDDTLNLETMENTRDLLSFWYYLRTVPLQEGDTIIVNVHKSKQTSAIECLVLAPEKIKTGLGSFSAIRVAPQTQGKGIFGKKGSMEIWYANDSSRYPVQIKTRFKYGSIIFKLKNVEP
ncbi:MAG TPA: DUF3108 domain-containing protein [bacterium]